MFTYIAVDGKDFDKSNFLKSIESKHIVFPMFTVGSFLYKQWPSVDRTGDIGNFSGDDIAIISIEDLPKGFYNLMKGDVLNLLYQHGLKRNIIPSIVVISNFDSPKSWCFYVGNIDNCEDLDNTILEIISVFKGDGPRNILKVKAKWSKFINKIYPLPVEVGAAIIGSVTALVCKYL